MSTIHVITSRNDPLEIKYVAYSKRNATENASVGLIISAKCEHETVVSEILRCSLNVCQEDETHLIQLFFIPQFKNDDPETVLTHYVVSLTNPPDGSVLVWPIGFPINKNLTPQILATAILYGATVLDLAVSTLSVGGQRYVRI